MENLRIIREKRGKSQISITVNLGIAQENISNYESGKSKPTVDNLIKMAKYLDTSTDYLLGLTNDQTPTRLFNKSNLTEKELDFLIKFSKLAVEDQIKLIGYMDALAYIANQN